MGPLVGLGEENELLVDPLVELIVLPAVVSALVIVLT